VKLNNKQIQVMWKCISFALTNCTSLCSESQSQQPVSLSIKTFQDIHHHHNTTILRPFFWDHPGEPVPVDFMMQGKINRSRHTDHPAGCQSIWTNQCPPPQSPHLFTGRMPFLSANQQCQSTEGNQHIRIREKTLELS